MRVCRAIFRVDFETSFEMMDRPGTIARTLVDAAGRDFFSDLREERQRRELRAFRHSDERTLALTALPDAIFFNLESTEGIPVARLLDDKDFVTATKVVSRLRSFFQIKVESRIGFKLTMFDKLDASTTSVVQACSKLVNGAADETISKLLGRPYDYGFSFDGKNDSSVAYHLRFGPYRGPEEVDRYFQTMKERFAKCDFNVVLDVDQYEMQTAYGPDLAWWKPYAKSATAIAHKIPLLISSEIRTG